MEKKLHFWLCIALLSFSLNHLFANNTILANHIIMEDVSACELPLPDSFRVDGFGSGYVSLAWNPNNLGDDYLLTIFQENNNGGFDSLNAVLVYDADTYTINNLTSPKAYKFRIQPVCPNGKVNTNVSAYTPPVNLILELTTNGISPNIYQYVPCNNIPIPQKPTDWIGFQLTDLSTNSTATFQVEVTNGNYSGKVHRVTALEENQILVAANEEEYWPTSLPVEADLIFKVGKVAGPAALEFYERVNVNVHENFVDICPYSTWSRIGFNIRTIKGQLGGNWGKITPNRISKTVRIQNPIKKSINVFFEDDLIQEKLTQIEMRAISGSLIYCAKTHISGQSLNIELDKEISNGIYILTICQGDDVWNFKVLVLND